MGVSRESPHQSCKPDIFARNGEGWTTGWLSRGASDDNTALWKSWPVQLQHRCKAGPYWNHRLNRIGHPETGATSEKHGLWSNVLANPEDTTIGKLLAEFGSQCLFAISYLELHGMLPWLPLGHLLTNM